VLGVDVEPRHLALAAARHGELAPRLAFEERSVYALGLPDDAFDLVVCRHLLHAIPHPERVLRELLRVTRPGGTLHVIAEDYGMVHFPRRALDAEAFWAEVPREVGASVGTDMYVGRHAPALLHRLGATHVTVDYVVVDTLRVARATFAAIWEAWRDGYCEFLAEHAQVTAAEARAHFDDQLATLRDPASYAVWLVPVVSGRRA
jgi:SAM-dependent methyltransferase